MSEGVTAARAGAVGAGGAGGRAGFAEGASAHAPFGNLRSVLLKAFWVFVICSVGGLLVEEVYHLVVFHELQDRAGLLFGPFSPIYGIGGIVVFVLSHALRAKPLPLAFISFALAGGTVEFAVSFVLQNAFGILAWDYTGTFLSVCGRTNGYFMLMWGVLGTLCMKFLVPAFDRFIMPRLERVPSLLTVAFAVLIAADVVLTLVSFNCWFHRLDGMAPETPIQVICAAAFDDAFMADRFETMSLFPQDAAR